MKPFVSKTETSTSKQYSIKENIAYISDSLRMSDTI